MSQKNNLDYNCKARQGFLMMMANKWDEAESIFMKQTDESNLMLVSLSFVQTMEFFLSNSNNKHDMAVKCSLEAIKRCKDSNNKLKSSNEPAVILEFITNEILSLQCQACHSLLSLFRGSDIIGSCWNFKQVWNQHKKIYADFMVYVRNLNLEDCSSRRSEKGIKNDRPKKRVESNQSEEGKKISSKKNLTLDDVRLFDGLSSEFLLMLNVVELNQGSSPRKQGMAGRLGFLGSSKVMVCGRNCTNVTFEPESLSIVIGHLTFGYGLFLMAFHLMPQSTSLRVLMHLFGFQGSNGMQGIVEKLVLSGLSESCLSPFACCILLHFLCVTRPLMVMNSNNLATAHELPKIDLLLRRMQKLDGGNSMFYFYFKGKFHLIKGEFQEAVKNFELGVKNVEGDFKFICQHELSRCMMVSFDWLKAAKQLNEVRRNMPVMIVYHVYVTAVTFGATGNFRECNKLLMMINNHWKKKNKEASEFFGKRIYSWFSSGSPGRAPDSEVCFVLCLELLYLWNFMHVCSLRHLMDITHLLEMQKKKSTNNNSFVALCYLLEGVVTLETQIKKTGRKECVGRKEAENLFLKCLDYSKSNPTKAEEHVSAFANYELGLIKLHQGDLKLSREYFFQAKSHDPKHFFFKEKISNDLEKFIITTTKGHEYLAGEEVKVQKSKISRFLDFFRSKDKVISTSPKRSIPTEGFSEVTLSSLKISPRKTFIRIGGANDDCDDDDVVVGDVVVGGDDGDNDDVVGTERGSTMTKSCVVQ